MAPPPAPPPLPHTQPFSHQPLPVMASELSGLETWLPFNLALRSPSVGKILGPLLHFEIKIFFLIYLLLNFKYSSIYFF